MQKAGRQTLLLPEPEELTTPRPWPGGLPRCNLETILAEEPGLLLMGKTAGCLGKTAGLVPAS